MVKDTTSAILKFTGVSTELDPAYDVPLWNVTFSLAPGDLMLLRLERGRVRLPLADAAEGLAPPAQGAVELLGEDWRAMDLDRAAQQRSRIGRVFEGNNWLTAANLRENLTLPQRHHTGRSEDDIEDEALHLARFFGLPGLPAGTVKRTRPQDLNAASCIRAFLGEPVLVILERPARDLCFEILAPLVNVVRAARDRGAAVLWTADHPRVWNVVEGQATLKCTMFGSRISIDSAST